jgi:hypothetical protein
VKGQMRENKREHVGGARRWHCKKVSLPFFYHIFNSLKNTKKAANSEQTGHHSSPHNDGPFSCKKNLFTDRSTPAAK